MLYRTDEHRNPTAFTTDLAREAGLIEGTDFESGRPFDAGGQTLFTAKLLGDPIAITIKLIDAVGFYTKSGLIRWPYIAIPKELWDQLPEINTPSIPSKRDIIGFMYHREGGTDMLSLFPT